MKKNPVNPREYLRGTVSQIFPSWQRVSFLKERIVDISSMEKKTYQSNGNKLDIYTYRDKSHVLNCIFTTENIQKRDVVVKKVLNQEKQKYFFVDLCSNSSPDYLVQFYKDLKENLQYIPSKFYLQERNLLLMREYRVSFFLPMAFSAIEEEEGYVYFVDTADMIEGKVFTQEVFNDDPRKYLFAIKKDFYNKEKWYLEYSQKIILDVPNAESNDKRQKELVCSLFTRKNKKIKNRKLHCFFSVEKVIEKNSLTKKRVFRVIWIFRYNAGQINEKSFQKKIEKDLSGSFAYLQKF